jgi:transposase
MANKTISMINVRHILRLHSQGYSKLTIAMQTGVARNTLKKYLAAFAATGLTFGQISVLSDKDLEDMFVKPQDKPLSEKLQTLFSLFPAIDKALKKKGVTRQMLWAEYRQTHPGGLGLSQFKQYYAQWKAQVNPTMHMEHKAGDKLYIDFAGEKLHFTDPRNGQAQPVEVFVGILGASQLTYVEGVMTQQKEDFIAACENTLHYYQGVPAAIVPDNLKSAVTQSSKYEPTLNETFADFASHYGTTILPARAFRPRDKALVENAVRLIYSRIYVKIRAGRYYSLTELNVAIREGLEADALAGLAL